MPKSSKAIWTAIVMGLVASSSASYAADQTATSTAATPAASPAATPAAAPSKPIVLQQSDIKYMPMPGLPPGAEIAKIRGDLGKAEPYTIRFKLPNCYVIPSHWHTNDEEVTVISGIFNVGVGDKIDKSKSTALTVGGFQLVPGKVHHYVWSTGTTVVQLDGMGPRDTIFVNPKELIPLFKNGNNQCPKG